MKVPHSTLVCVGFFLYFFISNLYTAENNLGALTDRSVGFVPSTYKPLILS